MNVYKNVTFNNENVLIERLKQFIDLQKYENGSYEYVANEHEIKEECGDIINELVEIYKSPVHQIKYFITRPWCSMPIHVDGTMYGDKISSYLALNLPLLNTKNTFMCWYDAKIFQTNIKLDRYEDGNACTYDPLTATLITEPLEILSPVLVRTDIPHNVMNNNDTTRVIVSLRFKNDLRHITL
ncbi:hypothetical protein UFOVP257_240 [uncultured Caudovirales phage]|uniref:Uncharacterized protein n=1 Tax=uncultured Caudovirales phage TaxID=2100421 RepID=A0A6J5LFQ5_9CAUD|nr:hypothetical protein UFOVP257_240 [uncultured Caudovirales phage]